MAVHHETFHIADFVQKLPQLWARNESMMYYIFPFEDLITVEFRKYNPGASGSPNRIIWPPRNYLWATAGPKFCYQVDKRYRRQDDSLWRHQQLLRACGASNWKIS